MTFVLTVIIGIVVVPVALYFANVGPGPLNVPPSNTATSAASGSRTATPAHITSPTPTPKK